MEVLKLTTKIDESGYLNLNIPTPLAAVDVNIVIVLNPVPLEGKHKPNYDVSGVVGTINLAGRCSSNAEDSTG